MPVRLSLSHKLSHKLHPQDPCFPCNIGEHTSVYNGRSLGVQVVQGSGNVQAPEDAACAGMSGLLSAIRAPVMPDVVQHPVMYLQTCRISFPRPLDI
jgi:hypothetical protein